MLNKSQNRYMLIFSGLILIGAIILFTLAVDALPVQGYSDNATTFTLDFKTNQVSVNGVEYQPTYQPFKGESELRQFIYDSEFSKRDYPINSCGQIALDFMNYSRSLGYDVWILYIDRPYGRDHIINMTKAGSSYYSFDAAYSFGMMKNLDWWNVR